MPVTRLNHAVLYVRDVAKTREFYENVLGFKIKVWMEGRAAFFQAPGSTNDHDLGVFQIGSDAGASQAGRGAVGLYHLAWEVDTLAELSRLSGVLEARGSLVGSTDHTTTKSLYAMDPDGLEFEVCWILPLDALTPEVLADASASVMRPLDISKEIARYGAETRGGVGVSIPVV